MTMRGAQNALRFLTGLCVALIIVISPASAQERPASVIIIGIDRTAGWHEMTRDALRVAESILPILKPGDAIELRLISDASWPASNHIGSVRFPLADIPGTRSRLTTPAVRLHRQRAINSFRTAMKRSVVHYLQLLEAVGCPGPTETTDIAGFLEAAGERFGTYEASLQRRIIMISDFEERRHFSVDATLSDVEFTLFPLRQGDNAAEAKSQLDQWIAWLRKTTGAQRVSITRPVELPASRNPCE